MTPTPITRSLVEEISLATRAGGKDDPVDLARFQRLVRAGADPQAAFESLCDPRKHYHDPARALVARWLVSLPAVDPRNSSFLKAVAFLVARVL